MADSKIRDENYYQVNGWMLNRLGLKGTALQVYAIIYGFSQDGEGDFKGSLQYLQDFTNASRPTIIKALADLVEKGYIQKTETRVNGVQVNTYKTDLQVVKKLDPGGSKETLPVVKNLNQGSKETLPGVVKKLNQGSKETLPNNKEDNKTDNKADKKESTPRAVPDYSKTTFSFSMKTRIEEWLQYKAERKDKYTAKGLESLLTQVQNYVNEFGEVAVMEKIQDAMAGGWVGMNLHRLKEQGAKKHNAPSPGWGGRSEAKAADMQKDIDDFAALAASLGVKGA